MTQCRLDVMADDEEESFAVAAAGGHEVLGECRHLTRRGFALLDEKAGGGPRPGGGDLGGALCSPPHVKKEITPKSVFSPTPPPPGKRYRTVRHALACRGLRVD